MKTSKVFKLAFALSLLTSCARLTPQQVDERWHQAFRRDTACTEKSTNKKVYETKNVFGNIEESTYAFNCGGEKYACKTFWVDYQQYAKCKPKVSYSSK